MIMFIKCGIRGGLSQCSNRYARANNKYMPSYDRLKSSSYLMYYDVNNLYSWATCQNFDFTTIALDSATGYILEVDAECSHLHDAHLPFCPTREKLPSKRDNKPFATLFHHVLQFAQSSWLRDYIKVNTKFRPKIILTKILYKLMNNARKTGTVRQIIAKPNFHSRSVFSKNPIAIELRKFEVKFDKPVYVSMCIDIFKTDISKFDTNDYLSDNAYDIPLANKKISGLMKNENNGAIMQDLCIMFGDYTRCLNDAIEMTRIRSKLHEVYTISETKIALSPHDDKLYIIGYKKVIGKMGLLTVDHKRDRVISKQCLKMFQHNPDEFLRRFIIVNETWIHYFIPETKEQSKQWTSPSEPIPKKQTINDDYYAALLDRFNILKKKRSHLAKKKVLFHQDNARIHTCPTLYELLPHPTYSPDLAPCDYFLFRNLKKLFREKRFTTREQLIAETEAYFEGLDKSYYSDGLKKLENRWIKCIELKGDYVEK
ncbi:SETMR methyltransferase, partial [Acromyrmex insinuator]